MIPRNKQKITAKKSKSAPQTSFYSDNFYQEFSTRDGISL